MDLKLSFLLSAAIVFVGTHVILSHQLRGPLVSLLGRTGFVAAYSLVATVTLGWTIYAFAEAPVGPFAWPPYSLWSWLPAMALSYFALVLITGGVARNPAAPAPNAAELAATKEPDGVFAVTRHPVMWGIAIWALSHLVLVPDPRTLFLMGAFIVLALGGAAMQDGKKREVMGDAWKAWQDRTSYFPQSAGLGKVRPATWLTALVLWLAISWLHRPLGGISAGVWRWLG